VADFVPLEHGKFGLMKRATGFKVAKRLRNGKTILFLSG